MQASEASGTGYLLRLYWMLFGNAILWFIWACIIARRPKLLSTYDVIYWLIVVSLVLARYVDIRYQKGRTGSGDDFATLKHWRRYVAVLGIAALGGWAAAHALGRFLG